MGLSGQYLLLKAEGHAPEWPKPFETLESEGPWSYASRGFRGIEVDELEAALAALCDECICPGLALSIFDSDFAFVIACLPGTHPIRTLVGTYDPVDEYGPGVDNWPTGDPSTGLARWGEAIGIEDASSVWRVLSADPDTFAEGPVMDLLDLVGAKYPWTFDHTRPGLVLEGKDEVENAVKMIRYAAMRLGYRGTIGKSWLGDLPNRDILRVRLGEEGWERLRSRLTPEEWAGEFDPDPDWETRRDEVARKWETMQAEFLRETSGPRTDDS